jgi:hypothetical protein
LQVPKSVSQLRSFLGLARYYRRFIQHYGVICMPLHDLLKKDGFQWDQQHTNAFNQLKQKLSFAPVLALPDFTLPFTLETDALGIGIGALLMKKEDPLPFIVKPCVQR